MPIESAFTLGVATGNSIAVLLDFPSIEGQAVEVQSISVIRGGGRLLTDGDQAIVGISHRSDLLTAALLDDEDDFLTDINDYWWVHGLSETDNVTDHLAVPQLVAGPQTFVFFNSSGGTTGAR